MAHDESRAHSNGEPTESTLAVGTKGALRLLFSAEGVAAHSAYPQLGRSAIDALLDVLHDVRALEFPTDPILGDTTLNVGVVSGGVADNVVADEAHARVMIRLVSDADEVLARVREAASDRVEIREIVRVPPMRLAPIYGFSTLVVAYATDVPVLSAWGTPYLFGPGSINVAHWDDEHVEIEELHAAIAAYERLALAALERVAGMAHRLRASPPMPQDIADRKQTILVADDHEDTRVILRHYFEAMGYDVLEAQDGEQALASMKVSHPHAVVLDIQMPRMDGIQVLRAVRGDGTLRASGSSRSALTRSPTKSGKSGSGRGRLPRETRRSESRPRGGAIAHGSRPRRLVGRHRLAGRCRAPRTLLLVLPPNRLGNHRRCRTMANELAIPPETSRECFRARWLCHVHRSPSATAPIRHRFGSRCIDLDRPSA